MIGAITLGLLLLNVVAFACFGADKRRAENGMRRISEADLLRLAFVGGTPGAYLARLHFRHKTRKQPFSSYLALIAMVQAGVAGGLAIALIG